MNPNQKLIIESLKEAMIKEELAVPLYTSHIEQSLFWSGLTIKKQKLIIEILKTLQRESEFHAQSFQKVLKIYSK